MERKNSKKPFFASFLEKQIQDPEKIQGGGITSPSVDMVTLPTKDQLTSSTLDSVTLPIRDNVVTMKHPSDSDEAGELDSL
ncbi:MAG: microviridin/marinostatin family tricyclic proteinase inhibitor [Chryseobacterium sp.]|jgi:hypothetical protein|uniref:microviridin/marinostatin family tricyclic proteinase inhibitor n=1 Tax=Chryseobacterium sp. TaxID=1871047 RepID=UPI002818DBB0|nr:microviridin/marinostatin family tricyclic proteinase inhibitor [Chryseobacterium sp.]MDR2238534.1 microviridin/marinostatin family tricyclic proteinase inhibitor [Chryseobacterium sp.]